MSTKKQSSERKAKPSAQVVGRSLDQFVRQEMVLVTGVGNTEWVWKSVSCAAAYHNGKFYEYHDGGQNLFECLTRNSQRHVIKRVEPNTALTLDAHGNKAGSEEKT